MWWLSLVLHMCTQLLATPTFRVSQVHQSYLPIHTCPYYSVSAISLYLVYCYAASSQPVHIKLTVLVGRHSTPASLTFVSVFLCFNFRPSQDRRGYASSVYSTVYLSLIMLLSNLSPSLSFRDISFFNPLLNPFFHRLNDDL